MIPCKCKICRHRTGSHCGFYHGVCEELQDDSEFNSCGILSADPQWERRTKTKKEKRELDASLKVEGVMNGGIDNAQLICDASFNSGGLTSA